MKIISINVNGIRAAARKGMYEWLAKVDPDVVCLQELKAQEDQIAGEPFHPEGYYSYFHPAEKKGYSGVGIYCKQKPDQVHIGLGAIDQADWKDIDYEGRYIQADFGDLSVASLYMPSGSSKEERQLIKYDMMAQFEPVLQEMSSSNREFVICGDWNIAHKNIDIKNWRGNQKNSGFLPEERAWLDWLFDEAGFVDAFREINQEEEQYTWWSNRGQAWANNTGWRIDYHMVTPGLKDKIIPGSDLIYKEERFSDHAPLIIEYDL
ncbi:MAG: exodeoxyribonuclease III [Arenicella sp.]